MFGARVLQLGLKCKFYAQSEDDPACAIGNYIVGPLDDETKIIAFANDCDFITLENEFISAKSLSKIQLQSGTPIFPSPSAYQKIETKPAQKKLMEELEIPVAPYRVVKSWKE